MTPTSDSRGIQITSARDAALIDAQARWLCQGRGHQRELGPACESCHADILQLHDEEGAP